MAKYICKIPIKTSHNTQIVEGEECEVEIYITKNGSSTVTVRNKVQIQFHIDLKTFKIAFEKCTRITKE